MISPKKEGQDFKSVLFGSINKKLLFWFLIISIVPLLLVGYIAVESFTGNTYSDTIYEGNVELTLQSRTINSFLDAVENDVLFLSQMDNVRKVMNYEDQNKYYEKLAEIEHDFMALSKSKSEYYKIRYIDEKGMEQVFVENSKKAPRIIPKNELKNRKTEYYFNDTINATEGTVFVSPLEPNIEEEILENRGTDLEPIYVPTISYSTPVYNENGEEKGIIIIDVYADYLLDSIKTPYEPGQKNMIVNSNGYYLMHPDSSKEWGFVFGLDEKISKDYLSVSDDILKGSYVQTISENDEKIFLFKRIYPSGNVTKSVSSGHYKEIISYPQGEEYYWILIKEINKDSITSIIYNTVRETYTVSFIIITGILIISFLVSKQISKPIKDLENAAENIEKGNFDTRLNIKTGDELESLGKTMNHTIQTLKKTDEVRKQLDNAKTEFLSITSHELRSPMTPMKAQLQMILKGYTGKLNKKQKNSLNIVLRNTERLDEIIKDFLEISRIEAARLKFEFIKTDLTKYIHQMVKEMDGFMPEKNIKIETKLGKLPEIEVDPNRVMQIFRNLLTNAKKFSPENSKITIGGKAKEDYIKFWVKDRGIGIASEEKLRVFEPFYQAEQTIYRKHGGTGLGLTICKGIIEAQHGNIWVESKKRKGTTFFFTIPFKPVKELTSIKLLFSQKKNINRRLEALFRMLLGPLGAEEFEKLQRGHYATKEKINKYIKSLVKRGVISKVRGNYFKKKVEEIYKEETGRSENK